MKTLLVYYTRTKTTKKVADKIKNKLKCDLEEIIDTKKRQGAIGWISSGKDATFKKLTKIKKLQKNLADYDLIIIGTPIWSWSMTPAIRTFLSENKDILNQENKKIALFCTQGGSGGEKTFLEIENLLDQKAISRLELSTKEVIKDNYDAQIEEFIKNLES